MELTGRTLVGTAAARGIEAARCRATPTSRGFVENANCGPYLLALVDLYEGPRMMTIIVEADPTAVAIDRRVEVVLHDTGAGSALPRFHPVGG